MNVVRSFLNLMSFADANDAVVVSPVVTSLIILSFGVYLIILLLKYGLFFLLFYHV